MKLIKKLICGDATGLLGRELINSRSPPGYAFEEEFVVAVVAARTTLNFFLVSLMKIRREVIF